MLTYCLISLCFFSAGWLACAGWMAHQQNRKEWEAEISRLKRQL